VLRRDGESSAASVGMNIRMGYRDETNAIGPCRNSAPLKASACRLQVSLSLREASRAIARVGPRPIVIRLIVSVNALSAALQSTTFARAGASFPLQALMADRGGKNAARSLARAQGTESRLTERLQGKEKDTLLVETAHHETRMPSTFRFRRRP
jgi:hypothetical protein